MFSSGKKGQFYHFLFQLGLLFNQGEKTKWVAGLVKHSEVTFEALPQFTVQVVNSIDIGSVCKKMYFLLQCVLFQSVFSNKSSQTLKMLWDGKCTWQQGLSIGSSLAYLIFVTKFTCETCGEKSVKWRNFRFLYMANGEKSEKCSGISDFFT